MKLDDFTLSRGITLASVEVIKKGIQSLPDNVLRLQEGPLEVAINEGCIIIASMGLRSIGEIQVPKGSTDIGYHGGDDMHQIRFTYEGQDYAFQIFTNSRSKR